MLRTPIVFGISMAGRRNRRMFVALTYVVLSSVMAAISVFPIGGNQNAVLGTGLILAYCVVGLGVFGKLVRQTVLPRLRGGEMLGFHLTPVRRQMDDPDERELAVRNAAYYQAFRALAVYLVVVCLAALFGFESLSGLTAVVALQILTMPVLAMVFTLPQAIILWTEPDAPEEARI